MIPPNVFLDLGDLKKDSVTIKWLVNEAIKKLQEIIDILLKKPDAQGCTAAPKTNA